MNGTRFVRLVLLVLVAVCVLGVPARAAAFTERSGDNVSVREQIDDDLYVFGSSIEVSGDVRGDVVAFGQNVRVTGDVTGDVIAGGQNVTVSGRVGGSVRLAGSDVFVDGEVEEDMLAAGNDVRLTETGSVGRDAVLAGSFIAIGGDVGGDMRGAAERIRIGAPVGGDVTADVSRLTIESGGRVDGDLTYYSDNDAEIDGEIRGETTRRPARARADREPDPAASVIFGILGWIRGLVGMALLALIAVLVARPLMERAAERGWHGGTLASLGIGLGIFAVALPVAGIVFLMGLLVGGWWIAFVWLAIVWLLAVFGAVVGALAVGRWLVGALFHRDVHPLAAVMLGVLVLSVLGAIPFIGWLVYFAAVLLGMGALVLALFVPRQPRPEEPVITPVGM